MNTHSKDTPGTDSTDGKRRVNVGDVILVALPDPQPPGTRLLLRLAGHLMPVRVLDHGAQILTDDGAELSPPITHRDAGLSEDSEGLYAEPLPDTIWRVTLDGVPISPQLGWPDACWMWTFHNQHHSVTYATTYGGYGWRKFPRVDPILPSELPASYEQYAELVTSRFDRDPHTAANSLPAASEYTEWGFRYWTEVLDMPPEREYSCHRCGKPFGH